MQRVFISSTSSDLKKHRQIARDVCIRLDLHPVMMEDMRSMEEGATKGSKELLHKANLYVGIFAFRYGYIENGYTQSVTEIEYEYAGERGKDRLCFLGDPRHFTISAVDLENAAHQKALRERIQKSHIVTWFTTKKDFENKLTTTLVGWLKDNRGGSLSTVSSRAILAPPDEIAESELPRESRLIDREDVLRQLDELLAKKERVRILLQGFSGVGKTAITAILAKRITENNGVVLWLHAGSTDSDGLCDALAHPFPDQSAEVTSVAGEAKFQTLRKLLQNTNVNLIVLDDAWNGMALNQLIKNAIPAKIPVIVTSRIRYADLKLVMLGELDRTHSKLILESYGTEQYPLDLKQSPEADTLCEMLGDNPFALCVAGQTIASYKIQPQELIDLIREKPYELEIPGGYASSGRTSIKALLEVSLDKLTPPVREVFHAFGAMFVPVTTVNLLEIYLRQVGGDANEVKRSLLKLQEQGLIERTSDMIPTYKVQNLAYSYVRNRFLEKWRDYQVSFQTIKAYLTQYQDNLAAIDAEINNILGAAQIASKQNKHDVLIDIMYALAVNGVPYFTARGYTENSLKLLKSAIEAAQTTKNLQAAHYFLCKLGDHYDLFEGDPDRALTTYLLAFKFAEELKDQQRQAILLTTIGIMRFVQGADDYDTYQQRALEIAQASQDNYPLSLIAFNRGYVAQNQKPSDNDAACRFYHEASQLALPLITLEHPAAPRLREIHFISQLNLGAIEHDSGDFKLAETTHQRLLNFAKEVGNHLWMGYASKSLGEDLHQQGETRRNEAQATFEAALYYFKQVGAIAQIKHLKQFMVNDHYPIPSDFQ